MPTVFSRLRRKQPHESPEPECDCGIYAASLDRLDRYLADAPLLAVARVLGQVALWGTVIEREHGLRASHAYPLRMYVPADAGGQWRIARDDVASGLTSCAVPVEPLAARAAEAPARPPGGLTRPRSIRSRAGP